MERLKMFIACQALVWAISIVGILLTCVVLWESPVNFPLIALGYIARINFVVGLLVFIKGEIE